MWPPLTAEAKNSAQKSGLKATLKWGFNAKV